MMQMHYFLTKLALAHREGGLPLFTQMLRFPLLGSSGVDVHSRPLVSELVEAPMRQVRYVVAMSLDGYIAGPNGEADWIIMDPDIDFRALFEQFDTFLLGRRTFQGMGGAGGGGQAGVQSRVCAGTGRRGDCASVTRGWGEGGLVGGGRRGR